jgi:hypothetical protein
MAEPDCTQFGFNTNSRKPQIEMAEIAEHIGMVVMWLRGGQVHINAEPVQMLGPNSTPFNPITE